ncbi:hypothetical protein IWX49DRAFT_594686 [Phyllosticta citricarpa]|uniref:Uncharacterized protein n=2 Tax=Phyllosticta TaxID=121621 RepID=A0ABR1LMV4_9PEZI
MAKDTLPLLESFICATHVFSTSVTQTSCPIWEAPFSQHHRVIHEQLQSRNARLVRICRQAWEPPMAQYAPSSHEQSDL